MSNDALRKHDMEQLIAMEREIEPTKNEAIARQAIEIAARWLRKADNQAKMLEQYQKMMKLIPEDMIRVVKAAVKTEKLYTHEEAWEMIEGGGEE